MYLVPQFSSPLIAKYKFYFSLLLSIPQSDVKCKYLCKKILKPRTKLKKSCAGFFLCDLQNEVAYNPAYLRGVASFGKFKGNLAYTAKIKL